MEYFSVDELRKMSGMRIVLNPGLPGPWGEAVKNFAYVKGIPFIAGRIERGGENLPLKAWTGQSSAPVIAWNDERPRSIWNDQLWLFERLAPNPPLIPSTPEDRAILFGYANELCAENGLGWSRRLMMVHRMLTDPHLPADARAFASYAGGKYGYTPANAAAAPSRVASIVRLFAHRLQLQRARGSQFLIGDQLSALDIYWASFAAVLRPLPDELCPMNPIFREGYSDIGPFVEAALSPLLLAHRDFIYRTYLKLPMDFNDSGPTAAVAPSEPSSAPSPARVSVGTATAGELQTGGGSERKVAVIVGVGPGLGAALARRFARGGHAVALLARSSKFIDGLREQMTKEDHEALAITIDAGDPSSVASAFATIKQKLGAPDVLIYNAGLFAMGGILDLAPEKFLDAWMVNCCGGFLSAQQVLPDMVRKKQGTILFTGATASIRGGAKFSPVATGKFGLRALSQSLAREFGGHGIHCAHVVIDGQIDTPAVRAMFPQRDTHTFLSAQALAETYWRLHMQHPSVWSQEVDVRPNVEKF